MANPALILQGDHDIWLSGSFSGSDLSLGGEALDANGTQSAFLARFSPEGNLTYAQSFPGLLITALSPDEGRPPSPESSAMRKSYSKTTYPSSLAGRK